MTATVDRHAQALAALEKANRVRSQRAAIKQHLGRQTSREAALQASRMIEQPGNTIAGMRIADLLLALPGIRWAKTRRILTTAGNGLAVSPTRPVGQLSPVTRQRIVAELYRHADRDLGYRRGSPS